MSEIFEQQILRDHLAGETGLRALLEEVTLVKPYDGMNFDKIAEWMAEQTAVNGEMVIAASVVVLSHSTADDVFSEACDLAVQLHSAKWLPELDMKRTITLGELKEKGAEEVFEVELTRFRKRLSGLSLPNRADVFFRHVPIKQPMLRTLRLDRGLSQEKLAELADLHRNYVGGVVDRMRGDCSFPS